MRAAHAELGRFSGRRLLFRRQVVRQQFPDPVDVEFAEAEHLRLAFDFDSGRVDRVFEHRITLFDHHATVDRGRKAADRFHRKRISEAELEHRRIGRRVADVLIADSGSDDSELVRAADLLREFALFVQRLQLIQRSAEFVMGDPGVSRDHHVALRVFVEFRRVRLNPAAAGQDALRMADPRRHPEQHRTAELLGKLKGADQKIVTLL
ncbi:hypothetical protein SDC9_165914 [bioreactor metagenome]|uniref:Uncharacterized protein n=1 Tax=bioreactor metagenome TaxID=1076179 RepID=A0A645G341_9ZZZZ